MREGGSGGPSCFLPERSFRTGGGRPLLPGDKGQEKKEGLQLVPGEA